MGEAQSAQREEKKDAAVKEEEVEVEGGTGEDVQTEGDTEDKPLKTNGQISELNGKADGTIAAINDHCEDDIAPQAILSANEAINQTEMPLTGVTDDETPLENAEINEKMLPDEVDADEEAPGEVIEMDAKQNDINESFRKFFSNIGLKLTVKRGSNVEIPTNVPEEETEKPEEDVRDTAEEMKSENTEQNVDFNTAQETQDNDSTTCPSTSENVLENAEEEAKSTETKEEIQPDDAEAEMTPPVDEDEEQNKAVEPCPMSPTSPEGDVVDSPFKRFFTTGIFSGLRKKSKQTEDDTVEKELVDMGKNEATDELVQDQQEDKETITTPAENEPKEESSPEVDKNKSGSVDEEITPEIVDSQEKSKVQASPLKKLLSGSSFKKQKKRQRSRKSSDAKSSDSGEHVSDQLLSSTESAENQKEESPAQPTTETDKEEDSPWASFKRLLTPKKRVKKPSQDETQISPPVEEVKPSEGEQVSDHSTEEGKKRKDSSVSWEAVLCGSGKKRSRKTSDSEDESPQIDDNKQDSGAKESTESPLESSNEGQDTETSSPKQTGSPPEEEAGSTWKSFKKLVTPKRKAKDEDENKDTVQSDSEVTQDESSFSIKKLLPGRKKRKSTEKQDQVSSDEAEREMVSDDEDYETPAVVPLSEFDTVETIVQIETQADIESYKPKETDSELHTDLNDETVEPVLQQDSSKTEAELVQEDEEALAAEVSKTSTTAEEPEDVTELISKHQQLSDIPEEGIITETMATPVTEGGGKDDTIAEDLVEITSEAVTAPEAADVTAADETEMLSAVSQLSDSESKTSGNATPVPAEYDVKDTESLLQQVAETISVSPTAIPVYTDEPSSERIVCSVSRQVHETCVKEEPNILEIHRKSDATTIKTGLKTEEIDAINELEATAQTESISDMKEAFSTEVVSEVPTEEFDTADTNVDEVHKADVVEIQESMKELEMTDDKTDDVVQDEGSLDQEDKDTLEAADVQEVESEETKDEMQEPQTLVEKDQISEKVDDEEEEAPAPDEAPTSTEEVEEVCGESLEKEEPLTEDIPAEETDTQEVKETKEGLTEVTAEPKDEEKEPQTGASKDEVIGVIETLDNEEVRVQSPEKEEAQPESITPAETDTDESKQAEEPENKEPPTDAPIDKVIETLDSEEGRVQSPDIEVVLPENKEPPAETEHPDVLEDESSTTLESEEAIAPSVEEKLTPEDKPPAEILQDEPEEETVQAEVTVEPVEASETPHDEEPGVVEPVQAATSDSEAGSPQLLEEEVVSEDVPAVETEIKAESENEQPVEPDVIETVEEVKSEQVAQEEPGPDKEAASVTDETETSDVAQVDPASEINEVQETESVAQEVEDVTPEVADEIQTLSAVNVSIVNEEAKSVQVLEKTVFSEETPAPHVINHVEVLDEPTHEGHVCEVEVSVEGEKAEQLPEAEAKIAAVQHAVVAQVITCNIKDVSTAIPDVLIEKPSEVHEPLIDKVISETEVKEAMETVTPLEVKDNVTETAKEGKAAMMMNVPTVEVDHRIQVQVVNVDIKSAETIVDSVIKVGVSENKEVIEVHQETIDEVENLSATVETEADVMNEKDQVTVQEVTQHVKENLPEPEPEPEPEPVVVIVEQEEVKEQPKEQEEVKEPEEQEEVKEPEAEEEEREVVESKVEESQEEMKDNAETSTERPEEEKEEEEKVPVAISDKSEIENQVSENIMQPSDIPESLEESIKKEDLEETKAEVYVLAQETPEELAVRKSSEIDIETKAAQNQMVTQSNTALVVPQNTGIISSVGTIESPSSLSLEFKLNIQFAGVKAPASPTPVIEKTEPVKHTDVSEVGVQVVEPVEPARITNPTQRVESDKQQAEVTEVAVQATEKNQEQAENSTAVITDQPVLLDVGIQARETTDGEEEEEEEEEEEKPTPNVQAAENTEPERQTETREEAELCDTKEEEGKEEEEPVKQPTEEETDQDVWLDAEEDIVIQEEEETEESHDTAEEPIETQTERKEEEEKEEEKDEQMTPDIKTEEEEEEEQEQEEEKQQETDMVEGRCDVESDSEDFTVALEHPDISTAVVTTEDWD